MNKCKWYIAGIFFGCLIFHSGVFAADHDLWQKSAGRGDGIPLISNNFSPSLSFDGLLAQKSTDTGGIKDTGMDDISKKSQADEDAMIAEAMLNPLSHLWLMFMQNDTYWYKGDILDTLGEDTKLMNTTLLMPVLSIQLTEEWKTIFRPIIPINSFDSIDSLNVSTGEVNGPAIGANFDRETGLGDIVLWTAFSNQYTAPFIWGFGPTLMLNTASDDLLGSGKWSAGPMALAFYLSEKWVLGGIFQHWWSFAGDDDFNVDTNLGPVTFQRSDVNLTDFQYVLRYRLSPTTNIGMGPNIRYNWESEELSLPVGIGGDILVKFGAVPVKIGAEIHYYAVQDDRFGPEWLFRLFFVPVVPSPGWSKKPLF